MKKVFLTLLIAFSLLALFTRGYKFSIRAESNRLIVGDSGGMGVFGTIQSAVDAASPGETIFVPNGNYFEHVFINKSLTLVGESASATIIDGQGVSGSVVWIYRSNVSFSGFTVKGSGGSASDYGVLLDHSSGSIVSQNRIFGNTNGVGLVFSNVNNTVTDNNITSNSINGVYVFSSGDNIVSSNNVSSNFVGLYFQQSSGNTVSRNIISSNDLDGIYLSSSYGNVFYHNNFDNAYNAESELPNIWSYGNEGNYWSDYHGQDLNSDGIGDTPYDIVQNSRDNYPLMGRFNDFKVSFDGVVNDLEIISNSSISSFTFETVPERRDRIVHFNAFSLNSSAGFGRISIPITLMTYPFIVLLNDEEVTPKLLNINDSSRTCTYLSYSGTNSSIEIIYSEILHLYYDLLDKYNNLQGNFSVLNSTYAMLIENFTKLQSDFAALNSLYTSLQSDFQDLNTTCQSLLANFANLQSDLQNLNNTYNELLVGFGSLQANLTSLSDSYNSLLNSYNSLQSSFSVLNSAYNGLSSGYTLLQAQLQTLNDTYHTLFDNYTRLQEEFNSLNSSYYGSILGSSEQAQNVRNLMYIFAGMTAIFIITTIYLSKKAHTGLKFKARSLEE